MVLVLLLLLLLCCCCSGDPLLSVYEKDSLPYLNVPAWSRRLPPIYTGLPPLSLSQGLRSPPGSSRTLPDYMNQVGMAQTKRLFSLLSENVRSLINQLEMWPSYDDNTGYLTWAFARYRSNNPLDNWTFLPALDDSDDDMIPSPIFPQVLRPWNATERSLIFAPARNLSDLYDQPALGNCLWTCAGNTVVASLGGWINPDDVYASEAIEKAVDQWNKNHDDCRAECTVIPQPSRFDLTPETYIVNVSSNGTPQWPSYLKFITTTTNKWEEDLFCSSKVPLISSFGSSFDQDWLNDVTELSVHFSHKNSGDPGNQLSLLRRYLRKRYFQMQIPTFNVEASSYLAISDRNVVAVIEGSDASLPPVIACDHYDTAYAEDVFYNNGTRQSTPGADDNVSASATLLAAARLLGGMKLKRTIWLVHLTGEEFPADDLGARALDSFLLSKQIVPRAIVVMDMLAWRSNTTDRVMQVNAGQSDASLQLAHCTISASQSLQSQLPVSLNATLRTRWSPLSYLYNTDAVIFDATRFPTILLNEHINLQQNFDRPYYHQSTDTVDHVHVHYGTSVARVAIETLARLAKK